ncbi:MAG: COG4223 family protein [Holosporaceae bacterium]
MSKPMTQSTPTPSDQVVEAASVALPAGEAVNATANPAGNQATEAASARPEMPKGRASAEWAAPSSGGADTSGAAGGKPSQGRGWSGMIVLVVVIVACFGAWQWWQQHGRQALRAQWSGGQSSTMANPAEEEGIVDESRDTQDSGAAADDSGTTANTDSQSADTDGGAASSPASRPIDDNDRTNRFLKQRVAELEQRLAEARQQGSAAKVGSATALEALAGGALGSLSGGAPSPFTPPTARVGAAAPLVASQDAMQIKQRLEKLEQAIAHQASQQTGWQRRQTAYLLLNQIRQQVAAGQAFRAQSANLAQLVGDLAGAGESLQTLQSLSLQGVPSVGQLRQYYADAARQAWSEQTEEAAQANPTAQSGWWGWTKQQIRQLVTVRPTAGRAEPGSVAAYLTDVETSLAAGDLERVHAALQHLPDSSLKALSQLSAGLSARLKADQALQDLEQRVVTAMAQTASTDAGGK